MEDRSLFTLPLNQIAEKCRQEDDHYHSSQKSDPRYCYELFRRAFQDNNQMAWDMIYQQYYSQMVRWIRGKEGVRNSGEEPDYFVNRGFGKFWTQARKKSFSEEFKTLGGILAYLKMCLTGEYIDYLRKHVMSKSKQIQVDLTEKIEQTVPSSLSLTAVEDKFINEEAIENMQQLIDDGLANEQERVALESIYYYNLSAKEILARHPQLFTSTTHIYRIKDNLMRRLRRRVNRKPANSGK